MKFIRFSFAAFFASVLISQSMMDAFSVLLSAALIYWFVKNKPVVNSGGNASLLSKMGLEKIWVFWFAVVFTGFLLHPIDIPYAITRVVEFKWVLLFYVFVEAIYHLKPHRQHLKFFLGLLFVVGAINLAFYFLAIPIFADWRYGVTEDGGVRAAGIFVNPMTFAHSFVLFNTFLLGVMVFDFKNWSREVRIFASITLAICLLGLALTYTRGVWIGFTVAIVFGAFLLKPKWGLVAIVSFFLLGVTAYTLVDQFRYKIHQTQLELNGHSERKELWRTHFYIFQENPIFGLGYGQNTRQLPEYYKLLKVPEGTLQSHAHNQYLHMMAGTGILGVFSYIIIWGYFLLQMIKLWRLKNLDNWERGAVLGILMGSVAFLVGGLTEANFEHSKVRFAVMLIWAYIIYLAKKHKILGWQLRQ